MFDRPHLLAGLMAFGADVEHRAESDVLVMRALAVELSPHNLAVVSLSRLGRRAGLRERTVRAALRRLIRDGFVVAHFEPGHGFCYSLRSPGQAPVETSNG
ncbi:MAG: hypothetical protein ACLFTL_12630 [Alphaproteobacteria bacterium]